MPSPIGFHCACHSPFASFRPGEILHRDAAQMALRDLEAVDPAAQSAFDGGVPDVVVDADRLRVEVPHDLVQIPDGRAHQADAGVRVVHGARLVPRVERRQLREPRLEALQLRRRTACPRRT